MAFLPCLSSKRLFHGSRGRPWESSAGVLAMAFSFYLARTNYYDSLYTLPVEEKAIMGAWPALATPCSPCLARKRR